MKEIIINIVDWFKGLFNSDKLLGKAPVQPLLSPESERKSKEEERINKIYSDSNNYIKELEEVCFLSKDTIYETLFYEVLENTKKIHKKIAEDINIPKTELSQFHKYYTFEFINTFTSALGDLKPKIEIKFEEPKLKLVQIKFDDKNLMRKYIDEALKLYSDSFVENTRKPEDDIYFNPKTQQQISLSQSYLDHYKKGYGSINDCDVYLGKSKNTLFPIFMVSKTSTIKMLDFTKNKVVVL